MKKGRMIETHRNSVSDSSKVHTLPHGKCMAYKGLHDAGQFDGDQRLQVRTRKQFAAVHEVCMT